MNFCTVVMYHYVRDLKNTRYPEIKGLHVELFKEQIAYCKKFYKFVTVQDLIACIDGKEELPKNAMLLTFDDGYIDHFNYVFPVLHKEKIQGCFFTSAWAVMEGKLLDVNKIHFILASQPDYNLIKQSLIEMINNYREQYGLAPTGEYLAQYEKPSRFDVGEVMFIKSMLQRVLPEDLRAIISDALFEKFVSVDEKAFARELYMDVEQLACMNRCGMYIGSHGYSHYWMSKVPEDVQRSEIDKALKLLKSVGSDTASWVMGYPYGDYNESLVKIIKEKGCKLAFTTNFDIAQVNGEKRFALARLDTNDLPKDGNSEPNQWTKKIME